jgi:hypothetical protein
MLALPTVASAITSQRNNSLRMLNRTIASDFYVLLLAAINRAARMWRTGEGTLMQRR